MPQERTTILSALGAVSLAVIFWGLAPVATRYLLFSIDPIHLLFARFLLSSILFIPLVWRMNKQKWTRKDLAWSILCGLISILGYNVCVTFGIRWIPASTASLLIATEPLWIILLSCLFSHEKLHIATLFGFILALFGVLTLIGWTVFSPGSSSTAFLGMGFTLFAALMWGIYTVAVRPISLRYGAIPSAGITTISGTAPLLLLANSQQLISLSAWNTQHWIIFLLLTIGSSVLGAFLWNYGVAYLPGTQAGIFLYLVPVIGVLGAGLFLKEHITVSDLISGGLILCGIIIAQLPLLGFSSQPAVENQAPDIL